MSTINVDIIQSASASNVTVAGNLIVTGTSSIVPYKKYVAWLNQSSPTSAPLAEVLENTLGTTITWSRTSTGTYLATVGSPVFTAFKTIVFMTVGGGAGVAYPIQFLANRQSNTEVFVLSVLTDSSSTPVDGRLAGSPIEIRVYN